MDISPFLPIAEHLELAGLVWRPEIGDEVLQRDNKDSVSILVDPQGLTPLELRSIFIWLPTLEQLVGQCEARQAVLLHLGLEMSQSQLLYKTVLQARSHNIEAIGESPRVALGLALRDLLIGNNVQNLH